MSQLQAISRYTLANLNPGGMLLLKVNTKRFTQIISQKDIRTRTLLALNSEGFQSIAKSRRGRGFYNFFGIPQENLIFALRVPGSIIELAYQRTGMSMGGLSKVSRRFYGVAYLVYTPYCRPLRGVYSVEFLPVK
jgi:hypothetical protein